MAADDQIKCTAQLFRQTRSNARQLLVGPTDYQFLDETDPKTMVYINGGAPNGGGQTLPSAQIGLESGEYLVVSIKNRMGSNKTLDSTGSTSGKFLLGIRALDKNTGTVFHKVLTTADKSTDLFADDGTMVDAKDSDAYAFKVPEGERWALHGVWQADFRTTA